MYFIFSSLSLKEHNIYSLDILMDTVVGRNEQGKHIQSPSLVEKRTTLGRVEQNLV